MTVQLPVEFGGAGGSCVIIGAVLRRRVFQCCVQSGSAERLQCCRQMLCNMHAAVACRHRRVRAGDAGAAGGRAAAGAPLGPPALSLIHI